MKIWNQIETLPREEIEKIQLEKLKNIVNYAYENVPLYKKKFNAVGYKPGDIQKLSDLQHLPFTTKEDFRQNYPLGLLAVPRKKIVRIHASSGTTGLPTVVAYTKNDLLKWAELVARMQTAAGITDEDVVQIAFGYGLFTGGFGHHYGLEKIGAMVVPAASGNTERQIKLMQDFGTTALICTPSYALHIAEVAKEMGVIDNLKLKYGLFGGEPMSDGIRSKIEERLHILATDNYGLSEVFGPGVSGECPYKAGLHIAEDFFIPEIIDEEGRVLKDGTKGELVFTTIDREAVPVIRYRTHDITKLNYEPCQCGRTSVRMDKVLHRNDDMLIVRGVNLFPSQIEEVLMQIDGIEPHYVIILTKENAMDKIEVQVEISDFLFKDKMKDLNLVHKHLKEAIEKMINVKIDLKLVEPKTFERTAGKAKHVIDQRGN